MISKISRPILFLYTFIFTIIILTITLYTSYYAHSQRLWLRELIHAQIFKIPLIVYVILIALVVSGLVLIIVHFVQRSQYAEIETKLSLLAKGAVDDSIFYSDEIVEIGNPNLAGMLQDVEKIHATLIEMTKELQEYSGRPALVSGVSKEDIVKEERHRLARELHDSVSQQLFAASMLLSAVQEEEETFAVNPALSKQLATVSTIVNDSQAEMRALLLHLRPINLEGKSLKKGIEQLLVELTTKVKIDLTWDIADLSLKKAIEDHLFRIVQELLSNTLRHSKAKSLEVYLQRVENNVHLRLVDDGVGFDTTETTAGSYGLNNIKERVAGMGGTCKIISFKGQGTSVEIRVPILEGEAIND
ncbi:sensor histidine kinase [Vagococcus coleopterorum]|uniref:Sensor histidine kinase n=1 Tax=Vagococcus coleopterorum TaxID=2714946 RepID=A0A6G8AMY7_9ENTE|nr:sensor histidine kinase [Vagococcus coleopterorum]QIL46329.1 sensor histidine kinase [Vagococcus coleopterorum]